MEITPMIEPRPQGKRSGLRFIMLLLIVFIVVAAAVLGWLASRPTPNKEMIIPSYMEKSSPIMIEGEWTHQYALGSGEGMLIPLSLAEQLFGEAVHYEAASESIILTTATQVLHFRTGQLDATLNRKSIELRFAATKESDNLYLPLAPLTELFGVKAEEGAESGIVTLQVPGQAVQHAVVPEDAAKPIQLRDGPADSFPIVEQLEAGADVLLWSESEGWYKAQSNASGHIGFISKTAVSLTSVETFAANTEIVEPFGAWKSAGERVNLTWEAVYSANPKTSEIGELQGVNVVSPTWFELTDGAGNIRSKADASYSAWAKARGIQVWALFSNGFEPNRTTEALSTYESRSTMIQQLLAYAKSFHLQGINIDFENVYTKDKENLIQFVRELTPLLHEMNLVVSIDVTAKSNSEMWSAFLDRRSLGAVVDYMMVMAYDEHWASSPIAGSVSSLSWAENSIKRILEEDDVPSRKLILGIPLYTRVWTETTKEDGSKKVSSKSIGMGSTQNIIKDQKLTPVFSEQTGQNYVEYTEDGALKKIWIEDATSIKARAELAKKYNLGGVATWRRGFETSNIWGVLDETLQSRP
ncbi:MAG: glycosyl hydrolase family 18 protein [Candidatus Cohnella colombiensis]|uniref:Glycosyl hydrolase family 18 protein n=1 Tax=Candidatus Cohnella colombiensis TaxID=3121368 RepID=A0AA95JGB7_9BACL|nr:MAG: glycosyl hydrolase family 18 protein [Cohnella sp.]